ncbi:MULTISPECIES: O-antigen ligase family protein [Bradyrhizobium]|jgi:O-antigen ligase|nr:MULTISPECIES: O-antigen ligase family protein [Bradyrhizobium]AUC98277.1 ligase [Bradyrhizobium sp. SK17]KIU47735.1 ligase [Bradyrhizobium elkanii]MBK5655654.1 O-antigen ligase family protein [Rhizobium sp.]OCX28969.1 ligase [Bradyrhizobium sp. UASWS1016]
MASSASAPACPVWWRDPVRWRTGTDVVAVLIALSLPWSTSLVGIFGVVLLIAIAPTVDLKAFWALLKRPICVAPIALFCLALVGTLWSDAAWGARFYAVGPTAKLLVLPVLLYHFQRSTRGTAVFIAFLVSCTLLMLMSWLVFAYPHLALRAPAPGEQGVFVKNYIDQSQEFTLCAVALAYPIVMLLRARRIWPAILLIVIALSLFANMALVVVSRTALVTVPIMFAVFALLHLRWRSIVLIICAAATLSVVAWYASPQFRWTAESFQRDYKLYMERNEPTSLGLRLEFWRKSLGFFAEAPLIGHGTGATRGLFERVATGGVTQASGEVIGNPHNQTLNVAVQWGIVGVAILYAMWVLHLLLFRGGGFVNWIGLLVVVQNIFSSLFNSHIFDFHEGWMYVLGVGVAGGMALNERLGGDMEPEPPIRP